MYVRLEIESVVAEDLEKERNDYSYKLRSAKSVYITELILEFIEDHAYGYLYCVILFRSPTDLLQKLTVV